MTTLTTTTDPAPRFVRSADAYRPLVPERIPDHLDRLYRTARAITGSAQEAEELVSETLVRVLGRPRVIRGDDDLGYLLRSLRNTWADLLRTRSRRPATTAVPEGLEHDDPVAARCPHERAAAREVLAAIAELPAGQREAVLLVDVAGLSYGDAAASAGVPRGTIMSRVSRGRDAVVAALGG
jgi:RNA polymerase sigma-70 factor, ECF subfamily